MKSRLGQFFVWLGLRRIEQALDQHMNRKSNCQNRGGHDQGAELRRVADETWIAVTIYSRQPGNVHSKIERQYHYHYNHQIEQRNDLSGVLGPHGGIIA